ANDILIPMSFLTDTFVAVFTAYIAFSNTLALQVTSLFTDTTYEPDVFMTEGVPSEQGSILTTLPSRFATIPDLLRQNAQYQQATVVGADGLSEPTATDPIDAIVNIFCTFRTSEYIKTTTGTGFFIDADGVIMTNAHVAQFLLLTEAEQAGSAECVVRNGNPAIPKYTASLLYIPPAWVLENAAVLNDAQPMGTGERDYALLYVDGTVAGTPVPDTFPALPFSSELVSTRARDADITVAGYPAGELLLRGASVDLIPRSADTSISELYTFGSNRADVFSIRGSVVGAQGSSGGPVINDDGEVIGMIATRGDDSVDGAGSLRAITLSHVHRTMLEETGFTLSENLDGNLAFRSQIFNETLTPFLLSLLQSAE
ncbi:MAG: S1-C subfamily serine protease, partial [Candidatus Paceibacteria bacterium]